MYCEILILTMKLMDRKAQHHVSSFHLALKKDGASTLYLALLCHKMFKTLNISCVHLVSVQVENTWLSNFVQYLMSSYFSFRKFCRHFYTQSQLQYSYITDQEQFGFQYLVKGHFILPMTRCWICPLAIAAPTYTAKLYQFVQDLITCLVDLIFKADI